MCDSVEQLLQLLKDVLGEAVRRPQPDAHHNCLLDPDLVLFREQSNVDQVVEELTGGGGTIAM